MKLRRLIGIWLAAIVLCVGVGVAFAYPLLTDNGVAAAQTVVTDTEEIAQADAPPAFTVVSAVVGDSASWMTDLTVASKCDLPAPVLSASTPTMQIAAYPTGYGAKVIADLAKCDGADTEDQLFLLGSPSVQVVLGSETFSMFNRGDVVVALPSGSRSESDRIDSALTAALEEAQCLDLHPRVEDATRNPIDPDYSQWLAPFLVSIPAVPDIDPGPESDVPVIINVQAPLTVPAELQGPPAPKEATKPAELEWPGPQPTQATVNAPKADTQGPGCGWEFNGQTPPVQDAYSLQAQAEVVVEKGREELLVANEKWQKEVEIFNRELPSYQRKAQEWNDYADQVLIVQEQWSNQLKLLTLYNQQKQEFDQSKSAFDAWNRAYEESLKKWDNEIRSCKESSQSNALAESYCELLERPEILSQAPPSVIPEPTPPTLWSH